MTVRVEVVVRKAEEHEVVGALRDEVLRHAGRVLVARSGPGEAGAATGRAARVEVAVEELVGAPDGVAEVGGGRGSPDQPFEAKLMALAPAVDQERRCGGADSCVA